MPCSHRDIAPGIHPFVDHHIEFTGDNSLAPVRIARPHDFVDFAAPIDEMILRDAVALEQKLDREVDAVVDRDGNFHLRLLGDQFFHAIHTQARRDGDHQAVP